MGLRNDTESCTTPAVTFNVVVVGDILIELGTVIAFGPPSGIGPSQRYATPSTRMIPCHPTFYKVNQSTGCFTVLVD